MRETTNKLLRILTAERIPATGFVNSDLLPNVVHMLRARTYTFVSVDKALEDPAYRLPDVHAARGLSWLHRWMLAQGLTMQPEPVEPPFVRELFNAVQR